jgi:hypothetical protein
VIDNTYCGGPLLGGSNNSLNVFDWSTYGNIGRLSTCNIIAADTTAIPNNATEAAVVTSRVFTFDEQIRK